MAGAGYRLFVDGEILTAAQINTYLQQQSVMVFASASARTTALASVLAEGMVSYLADTNVVEIYTGAAWVSLDDPNAIQNSLLTTTGDIIYASAASTPARLASGPSGYVLTSGGAGVAPSWAAASSGALTSQSANLSADVTMTSANTYYDGASITLAAGTWLIIANIFFYDVASTGPGAMGAKLWDGSTVFASSEYRSGPVGFGGPHTLHAIVTPIANTTYKISAACSFANVIIKAAQVSNGSGNNAGHISAVKLA